MVRASRYMRQGVGHTKATSRISMRAARWAFFTGVSKTPSPSAPESVHWLCLQAAQARIQSLGLGGIDNGSVVIKKLAVQRILGMLQNNTLGVPLPCVLLVPLTETQDPSKGVNSLDDVAYGVGCLAIAQDNQEPTIAANMSTWLQWRQQVNRALRMQGQGDIPNLPPTVYEVTVSPKTIYDPAAWQAQFDVSYLEIRFISREPRGLNA